ncbi:MAG TPA: ABC transporter transmembrane domain-containing protein, partial [Taishania sp.]|nr:ABC transporter transmembrane domain-containing protein [Taishania sp.]
MKSLQYLYKYFIKYKWLLLLGTFFVFASNYFYIKMPLFLKDVIDSIINGENFIHVLGFNIPIDTSKASKVALYIGLVYMILVLLKSIFLFFMRQTIIKVSRYIEFDLKNEIYAHYQELGYNFYKENSTGDLMNRVSEDVSYVRTFLGPGIMYNINLVAIFTMIVYQMLNINVWLTFIVLIPLPIMSFLIYKVSEKMNQMSLVVQKEQSGL